ncbi:MAG: hypothetical protein GDA50_04125 [Alphaproteobacteria bacterium GM202ARS2]|nr:hypothetical protein [Alphaproteobacteria bacterium GM202ARS2]
MFAWFKTRGWLCARSETADQLAADSARIVIASEPVSPKPEPTPAQVRSGREHANRLLHWFQSECTEAGWIEGDPHIADFKEVRWAYETMCRELNWAPLNWVAVGRHFTPLTGGKLYRSAVDPRTGLKRAKDRIYVIRSAGQLRVVPTPRLPATQCEYRTDSDVGSRAA